MSTFKRPGAASARMLVASAIVALGCSSNTPAGSNASPDGGPLEDATADVASGSVPDAGTDACAQALPCTPSGGNDCLVGTTACDGTCGTVIQVTDGNECSDGVCVNGACIACVDGTPCAPQGIPCDYGLITCGAAGPVCADQHAQEPAGTACGAAGANTFCDSSGNCSCTANQPCVFTANPCHQGVTSCTVSGDVGVATCTDSGKEAPDAGAGCTVTDAGGEGGDE